MHWQHSVLFNTFSITSAVTSIYRIILRIFREFVYLSRFLREYFTMSKYLREFYHSVRMTISSSTTHSSLSNRASEIVCKHSKNAFFIFESSFDILFWSSLLCICLDANDSRTQNFRILYHEHTNSNFTSVSRCSWFTQTKRTQENYLMRKHELQMKSKIKQKAKKLLKQQKEVRLIKKRVEKYICRRCKNKTIKFDNNIKLHEHIRIRHVKKSKSTSVQQFVEFVVSFFISFVSSSRSIIFSFFTSSKFISFSMFASEIVRERSESISSISSAVTSRKSISWAEIASRSIVAFKFSRLSIATSKSMCKFSENANTVCSSTSSRISTSSRLYLIVNDLYRMFAEKSSSFDLQRHQMRFSFSKIIDKSNCKFDFIQSRITSYFNAMILFVFKSIKFEAFSAMHASIKQSIRISFSRIFRFFSSSIRIFFSTFSRSFSVCKHCQRRFVIYWFIDWVMPNVSKVENNEIFMKQRYWSFASSRSTLKKYWLFYFEKVITLKKLEHVVCLFVVLFARSFC